jgi:4'-phosphopantetheinyl transferase
MSTVVMPSFENGSGPIGELKIGEGMVHLWCGSYNDMQPYFQLLSQPLSKTERMRGEKYRFPNDRHNYVIRHGILRFLIGRYLYVNPKEIRFGVNEFGKPLIESTWRGDPLHFNMSTSNKMVLYAVARGRRVGVDMEFIKPMEDMDAIVESCFSFDENAEFNALPAKKRQEAFYQCWTQKEAFVKALGDGLFRRLDQFDVSVTPGTPAELRRTAWDPDEAARWTLKTITPAAGYIASLAVEGSGWSLTCRQLTPYNFMQEYACQTKQAGPKGSCLS